MNKRVVGTIAVIVFALLAVLGPFLYVAWTRCDATIYAPGFSKAKFRQVHKGMAKAEVEHILGKPLKNQDGRIEGCSEDENRWCYAWFDCAKIPHDDRVTNTWFKVREVDFDKYGRVKAILGSTEQFE